MSWNQGNNGNGYGQPQGYGPQEDVYGRLNHTRDVGRARFPFLEEGAKLALATLEEFQHTTHGPSARALLKVLESRTGKHAVGSYVVKIWKLVKPPFKPGMITEADEFADFCRKLKGAPAGYPIGNDIRVLMKERPNEQLARGTVIESTGVTKEYTKRDGSKSQWTNIYWIAVQQSPQDIAAMRQRLEAEGVPSTSDGPAQGPMQMQQVSYPAPGMQQFAQPSYAQQPVQTTQPGYNGTFNAGPPQQPAYGAPQAPAPQQGGFLAQIPPGPPQGNQGGNGGQGQW